MLKKTSLSFLITIWSCYRKPNNGTNKLCKLFISSHHHGTINRRKSRSELPLQQWVAAWKEKSGSLPVQTRCQNINIQVNRGKLCTMVIIGLFISHYIRAAIYNACIWVTDPFLTLIDSWRFNSLNIRDEDSRICKQRWSWWAGYLI